jgi:hypothetical protein
LSGKGSCGLTAKKLKAGTYHIVATYGGSLEFVGSFARRPSPSSSDELLLVAVRVAVDR